MRERFERLIYKHMSAESEGSSIGTYKEKALHRILKDLITEDSNCHEISVGDFVADVLCDGRISEIQTGSFAPLKKKLLYNVNETEYSVNVIHPIIYEKTILRIDKETGELIRKKKSPKKGDIFDLLPELFYIKDVFGTKDLRITVFFINAEERRYSERRRYCREGAYDSELIPLSLESVLVIRDKNCIKPYLPNADSFSTKEFSSHSRLKGRRLSLCLAFLVSIGLLSKEKVGKQNIYTKI